MTRAASPRAPARRRAAAVYWRNRRPRSSRSSCRSCSCSSFGAARPRPDVDGKPYADFFVPGMLGDGGGDDDVRRPRDHARRSGASAGMLKRVRGTPLPPARVPRRAGRVDGARAARWRPRSWSALGVVASASRRPTRCSSCSCWSCSAPCFAALGIAVARVRAERRGVVGGRQRHLPAGARCCRGPSSRSTGCRPPCRGSPTRCRSRTCSPRCARAYPRRGRTATTWRGCSCARLGRRAACWSRSAAFRWEPRGELSGSYDCPGNPRPETAARAGPRSLRLRLGAGGGAQQRASARRLRRDPEAEDHAADRDHHGRRDGASRRRLARVRALLIATVARHVPRLAAARAR